MAEQERELVELDWEKSWIVQTTERQSWVSWMSWMSW
jgi:hypothetical protein